MFVFALCLIGTALALPAIPPAPILPMGGVVIVSGHEGILPYGEAPMFTPLRTLEFKIEEEPKDEDPKEFNEEKELFEFEKKEEEETTVEEQPNTEEEPKKPVELKPETVFIKLDIPRPPAFIGNWLVSYLPFSLPPSISNWLTGGEKLPARYLHPGVLPGYVIVERPRA